MFTGIIEEIGSVIDINRNSITIDANISLNGMKLGDSVSVNGACLTVIKIAKTSFTVEIMPETRKLTNLGNKHYGDKLNLERALSPQGRLGGHFVQGHADGVGRLKSLIPEDEAIIAEFTAPAEIMLYLVKKCFIAVNGVSLTVTRHDQSSFAVSLVTFTRKSTNLGLLKTGDEVNLEVDIIAKYIEKFYTGNKQSSLSDLLYQYDYMKAR